MTTDSEGRELVTLELSGTIWDRFFTVAPLVLVGTLEPDGTPDLAPKHMVTPLGWDNYVGFVCTPDHATYRNAVRTGAFALSFPGPGSVVATSLTAAPRCDEGTKPGLGFVPTFPATRVEAPLVTGSYLFLECALEGTWDVFGRNSLVAGKIVAAHVEPDAVRRPDRDDAQILRALPLLAYLPPGRFAVVEESQAFPFHRGMSR